MLKVKKKHQLKEYEAFSRHLSILDKSLMIKIPSKIPKIINPYKCNGLLRSEQRGVNREVSSADTVRWRSANISCWGRVTRAHHFKFSVVSCAVVSFSTVV